MAARWVGQNSCSIFRRLCVRSLQRRFPIDDVLLLSGDIRDQVAKLSEIAPKYVLGSTNFGGGGATQISDRILKIRVTVEHVAKFGDDRPSDLCFAAALKRGFRSLAIYS